MKLVASLVVSLILSVSVGAAVAHADPISPPPATRCKVPAAGAKITAVFQPKVAVRDLATWFYGFSCKKVLFASELGDVSASVTMIGAGDAMTVKQATALFGNALTAAGLVATVKGDTWIVTRDPKAPASCAAAPGITPEEILAIAASTEEARKAHSITAVSETQFTIKRAALDKLLADQTEASKGARVVPSMRDGKPDGFKLYAIRVSSIYAALGFRNGDTVSTWDGVVLDNADVALTKFQSLKTAKHVEIGLVRRGKPVTLIFDITP